MNKYYAPVISYFTQAWFDEGWKKFCLVRNKYSKGSYAQEILKLELGMHPLQKEVFRYQGTYANGLDFGKIPVGGASDFIISHLGRDLDLLKNEISARGDKIRNDLLIPENFESTRFVLLVAAGYKLLGYEVEFLPIGRGAKTPDLLVKRNQREYLIECKQRNQDAADKNDYLFFGKLVEKYLPLLGFRGVTDTLVDIQVFFRLNAQIEQEIDLGLSRLIWRNQKTKCVNKFKIEKFSATSNPGLMSLLQSSGHFKNVPVFTRTEDMYIASSPLSKNVIVMTKNSKEDKIPSSIYSELFDANKHDKKGKKLIVYYDFGRGFSEWTNILGIKTFEEYKEVGQKLKNIDLFVYCQTLLKYKGATTEVRPTFNFVGDRTKIGGTPDQLNLFGFQGRTGMDAYIMPGFVSPVVDNSPSSIK